MKDRKWVSYQDRKWVSALRTKPEGSQEGSQELRPEMGFPLVRVVRVVRVVLPLFLTKPTGAFSAVTASPGRSFQTMRVEGRRPGRAGPEQRSQGGVRREHGTGATSGRIDPDRLRRALHLDATAHPSGDDTVNGHHVSPFYGCTCPDARLRGVTCKHLMAVRLARLDAEILNALKEALT